MEALWKKDIRKKILETRKGMDPMEVDRLSHRIISSLLKVTEFKNSKNVMAYLSFDNEVDSQELIKYCKEQGKRIFIPYCKKEGYKMIPTEIKDIKKEVIRNKFGYMEHKLEYLRPANIEDMDIIILPGVAFDKKCYRIGYGSGYYDRFLKNVKDKIPTIGLSYDFQILSTVQVEDFDVPLDYVITEKRIIVRS